MLPVSLLNYLPTPLYEELDDAGQELIDFIDNFIEEIFLEILAIWYFKHPEKIPEVTLPYWEQYFNIINVTSKTVRQRKTQIAFAVAEQKKRGLWTDSAKLIVDNIAGGDAQILTNGTGADWILTGNGLTPDTYYWGTLGYTDEDTDLGLDLLGSGNEIEIAGNIYIDVDNDSLTADEIEQLVIELRANAVPPYFVVYLGYTNISGIFILYTIIE